MQGIPCDARAVKSGYSVFSFPDTKRVRDLQSKYLSGNCVVNPHKFMYHRTMLKRNQGMQLKGKNIKQELSGIQVRFEPTAGVPYWYTEGNVVFNSVYRDTDLHKLRVKEGRVFTSKIDAVKSLT